MGEWRSGRRLILVIVCIGIIFFLLAPVIVTIPISLNSETSLAWPPAGFSLRWYQNLFEDPDWSSSLILSVEIGLGVVLLSLALGVPMALGIVRGRFPGQRILAGLVMMPLVIPSIIAAIGMYFVWTLGWQVGPIGIGGHIIGTVPGFVLAHGTLAMPYVVILVGASLGSVDRDLELAARGLGANPGRAFQAITLPLILPGVLAAAILAFLASWDEVIIALFLSSPAHITLPVRMLSQAENALDPTVAAVSAIVAVTTGVLFTVILVGRSRAAT
jgi:putative spermidine/putrescine transport system permease protein